MSLVGQINNLATRIGTEVKSIYAKQGDLASLSTTNKASLVAAINELWLGGGSGGSGLQIDDVTASTTTVYSSSRTTALINAKPSINDTTASGTSVYSSSKTDAQITAAIANRPIINDSAASGTAVYSSNKTDSQISAAVAALVNGSPGALDTLKELSDALGADPNFAATTATALGNRLRFDAAQVLTTPQKTQGLSNLGAVSATDVGDTAANFVSVFEAALVP